jgi:hypothetical protein
MPREPKREILPIPDIPAPEDRISLAMGIQ